MKRDILDKLKTWRNDREFYPLLMHGARQVGKTWLARELGKEFESFVELNFEENPELSTFFDGNLDPKILVPIISNYFHVSVKPGKTLLFFDEIQQCPRAITALRYFKEKMPDLHVIGAGSLLDFVLEGLSIPVGRIQNIYIYPLSFTEFLEVTGKSSLKKAASHGKMPEAFHSQLSHAVRDYCLVGGMPKVVEKFINENNFHDCQKVQTTIIETYRRDFLKYAKRQQIKYLDLVFDSVPLQLGKKFKYVNVDRERKSRDLSEALNLLEKAGIVYKIYHTDANGLPLGAEIDYQKFKVLFFDIGLTQRLLGTDLKQLLLDPDIFQINKGAIAEQFVGLELISTQSPFEKPRIFYWHSESKNSNAEIDYVIVSKNKIIPLEVKSGHKNRMRSLEIFLKAKKIDQGVCFANSQPAKFKTIDVLPIFSVSWFHSL